MDNCDGFVVFSSYRFPYLILLLMLLERGWS